MIEILELKHAWNRFDSWRAHDLFGMSLGDSVHRPHGIRCKEIHCPHGMNEVVYGRTTGCSKDLLLALDEYSMNGDIVSFAIALVI
jgi:hypothetical protein